MLTAQRMTYDDLMALPDDDCFHELVRGEILCMPVPKGDHGHIESLLNGALDRHLYNRALSLGWEPRQGRTARDRLVGYLACGEAGIRFSLPDDPDQVRGADVLYLTPEQFARLETVLRDEYIPEVPALVIEVISPSETAAYSNEKVTDYLAGGAQMMWQLFPKSRTARIYRAEGTTEAIPAGGTLTGGVVLPDFTLFLAELFD